LATGEVDGVQWFIVEYTEKVDEIEKTIRGFVGGKALDYLTSDPDGIRTLTLEDVIAQYPQFIAVSPKTVIVTSFANCYVTPDVTDAVVKTLEAGTEVALVAEEQGDFATWCVVMDCDGCYYFIGKQFFN